MPTGNIQCTHKFINQRCFAISLAKRAERVGEESFSPDLNKNLINETRPQKHMPSFWIPAFSLCRAVAPRTKRLFTNIPAEKGEKRQISCTPLFLFRLSSAWPINVEERIFCLRQMLNDFRHNCPHFPSHLLSLPPYPPHSPPCFLSVISAHKHPH